MAEPQNTVKTDSDFHLNRIILYTLFGVLLPTTALVVEILFGWSDQIYVNPIPNIICIIAIATVPLSIAVTIFRLKQKHAIHPIDLHANGFCLTISAIYAVIYAPISPFAGFGVIAYGMGLLPLSPIIAFFCILRLRKELKRRCVSPEPAKFAYLWKGFLSAILFMSASALPQAITEYGMIRIADSNPSNDASAIRLLRTFGSESVLLNACYGRDRVGLLPGREPALSTTEARELFYRVTGEPFNNHRKDHTPFEMRGGRNDRDLGGERIGQEVEEIELSSSRQDAILDPHLGFGYIEWTMIFTNHHRWQQQEARMYLSMPKGAVASRVTLWVNDEPREAAFGPKAKVRQAYQNVAVRQRRDPILVNWAGPDLLLAQCFPIPADGGTMKVRVGMSFPLEEQSGQLGFRPPIITADNFTMNKSLKHSIWYEEQTASGLNSYPMIDLTDEELRRHYQTLSTQLLVNSTPFRSPHPTNKGADQILKAERPSQETTPIPDAVVIDGSVSMKEQRYAISKWLTKYPQETFDLYFASDSVLHFHGTGNDCATWLLEQSFIGGQDCMPALVEAMRQIPEKPNNSDKQVYFFPGPQPIQLSSVEQINQRFERRPVPIRIINCLSSREYNALLEVAPLNVSENRYLTEDGSLVDNTVQYVEASSETELKEGPSHPRRIYIAEQTRLHANEAYQNQQASNRNVRLHEALAQLANEAANAYLVTQLSGAVVLETDRQYTENDLEAGDPNATPTVPEAKHYALILGICSLAWLGLQRKRHWRRQLN